MGPRASSAGFYHSDIWPGPKGDHRWPRIQIRTIEELLAGRGFAIPPRPVQYKAAERVSAQPATGNLWTTAAPAAASDAPATLDHFDLALSDDADADDEDEGEEEDEEDE